MTARRVFASVFLAVAVLAIAAPPPALARPPSMPAAFKVEDIRMSDGATIHVRSGGRGPAVVLIHGFGDTGEMWGPLAARLARRYTVIVPDLRGLGLSSKPPGGYDKRSQAGDIRTVVERLGQDRAAVVGHDIGAMVAYAYAARYPDKVTKLVVMDAPIPGVPPWDSIVRDQRLWHFNVGGKDAERLVEGRERIFLDHVWNDFAGDPARIDEQTRSYYSKLYAQPGAMRASFAQFNTIGSKDVADNAELAQRKLAMPVLAVGGEKSFGATMAATMRNVATNVQEAVVPGSGHWLMEERPEQTVTLVETFLDRR